MEKVRKHGVAQHGSRRRAAEELHGVEVDSWSRGGLTSLVRISP